MEPFFRRNTLQEDIHDNERRFHNVNLAADFNMEELSSEEEDDDAGASPPPAPTSDGSDTNSIQRHSNNNDNHDITFDTLDDFGEDTLHALMDSDLILGKVPPLSSLKSHRESEDDVGSGGVGEDREVDDADESFDDVTTSDSLLRGPLMAARSTVAMTPSAVRARFPPLNMSVGNDGKVDNSVTFSSSSSSNNKKNDTEDTSRRCTLHSKNKTPSNLVVRTEQKPPLGNNHELLLGEGDYDGMTPSAQRRHFLQSPQDLISTIGESVVDHATQPTNARRRDIPEDIDTPSHVRGGFVSPQGMGRKFTFDSNKLKGENTTPTFEDGSSILGDRVDDDENHRPKTSHPPTSIASNNSQVKQHFELKEEPMKRTTTNAISNTVKPFLKKGTRKEPSALHTLQSKGNTTTTTSTVKSDNERKERLARLEKMQQELREDYERREARKEEAQRERRRARMKEISRVNVDTKSGLEENTIAKKASAGNVTPSTARAKSAVKSRNVSVERTTQTKKIETMGVSLSPTVKSVVKQAKRNVRNQTPSADRGIETTGPADNEENTSVDKNDEESSVEEIPLAQEPGVDAPKPKPKQVKKTPARRPRSVSRPKTAQSKTSTGSLSPKRGAADPTTDKKAFEEWKKKETEEWALIKSMRRRQEAALREAEGERERAKAWAAAERENTRKWVEEQRAIIKKDRHKASNAALLASKRAEKNKSTDEADAADAELEELRAQITKLRMEAYEAKKLKEQVRKHEKTIAALKNQSGGMPKAAEKSAGRKVLGDRTASATNKPTGDVKPKTPQNARMEPTPKEEYPSHQPRKPLGIIVDTSNDDYVSEEEDTDVWLERNLNELNGVKNQAEERLNAAPAVGPFAISHQIHRKPYNAADYGAPAESATPSAQHRITATSPAFSNLNGAPSGTPKSSQFVTYQNGTQKEILSDGTTTVYFTNGDRKRTYANEKKGIVVYYYAATQTTQVTHQDGKQTYHFPNKQIEDHYPDGTKEIGYPDGTKRIIYTDGTTDTTFPDGVRVVDYPDGRQQVHQVC